MENILLSKDGDILTIKIDISKRNGKSSSGKSISVATTCGNVAVPGAEHIKLGLNCYTPIK